MTTEPGSQFPQNRFRVTSYNVATTKVMRGLPAAEQATVLAEYKTSLHRAATERSCQYTATTYDICCQYYKNIDALEAHNRALAQQDGDKDSIFSDSDSDDELPPLEPRSPSTPGSTTAAPDEEMQLFETVHEGRTLYVPANIAAMLTDAATQPPHSGEEQSDALSDDTSEISSDVSEEDHAPFGFPAKVVGNITNGEAIERVWMEEYLPTNKEDGPGLGYRLSDPSGPVHELQIISISGSRDVQCNCVDGKHTVYERHQQFAYVNKAGDVVVKKSQTLLLPLN
ncbi:hypothetical protein C8F04DRAFT_1274007 [Mycena alexandri]|uniref:Uncharacterized protein n=1 Tax=Mycena alexandri TaxID=1745969 RepID=A0AAD6S512_9AGAR|nr:hypothetical protein C8F04DRAFT_1274007 [Mycena alexandri]